MKSERRHELEKNELADVVSYEMNQFQPYIKTIVGVVIAVIAVGFTVAFLSQQQAAKSAAAWTEFYDVVATPSAEDMEKFGEDHAQSPAGQWAILAAADMKLRGGTIGMFTDRKEAEVNLDQAKKLFQQALDSAKSDKMLRRRAQLGLAETYDALNEPEEAEKVYESLIKEGAEDPFGKVATERLAILKRLNDEQWYTWFAKQTPTPPTPPGGGNPLNMNDLPGRDDLKTPGGDLSLPNLIEQSLKDLDKKDDDIKLPSEEKKADEPKTDEPKSEEKKDETKPAEPPAAEEKKADEKPAEEKKTDAAPPAEPAPPAEEKKAEEKKPEEKPAEEKPAEEQKAD